MSNNNVKKNVKVADDCMSVIAGISAADVEGVDSLGTVSNKKVLPFLGGNNLKQGVEVKKSANGLDVDITLTIKNNYDIQKVSKNVQEKVKESLESMLDMNVDKIKIHVAGVATN